MRWRSACARWASGYALGAPADHIVWLVVRDAMQPVVGFGAIVGGAVTAALARAVQRLVFGVSALDPATLAGVAATLAVAAAIASAGPARRALRASESGGGAPELTAWLLILRAF